MKLRFVLVVLTALLLAPAFARLHSHYNMGPAHRFTPAVGERVNFVSFSNGCIIDTRQGEPNLPARLHVDESFSDRLYYIIQFSGPIDQRWFKELERAGISAFGYLPHYAVLAKMDAGQREFAASLPMVRWTGIFQPAYKHEADLLHATGLKDINILLMPEEQASAVTDLIELLGGAVKQVMTTAFGTTIDASLDASHLADLCRLNQVLWIQERTEPTLHNSDCQWVTQTGWQATSPGDTSSAARRIWQKGVRGQGVILSITDTGLNIGHDMFRDPAMPVSSPGIWPEHRKVVAFKLYEGADGGESVHHGSHVCGTVAGSDSVNGGTSYYDGMAIDARLQFTDVTDLFSNFVIPSDFTTIWDTVYLGRGLPDSIRPIKQHSGSWGEPSTSGGYRIEDASTDAYCWRHKDFTYITSAGNRGDPMSVSSPGLAKNVITVGADSSGIASNRIAQFSSRGPTQDNRIKPDIMAPGVRLYSADNAPSINSYSRMSGTSMSSPAVNGTVGLMRCYLQEGYYPSGAAVPGDRLPYNSSALLRSMALVSADPNVGSYTVPSFDIGWGRIDADSVLYFDGDDRGLILCDDTFGLATGEYKETQFQVCSQIPLRVCLVWTDTAASPTASPTLINDLNLELTSPGGTVYRGNRYSSGQSEPNPTLWDTLNTEECCRVEMPDTGLWTIKVYGQNVRTAENQWFAWAITGGAVPVGGVEEGRNLPVDFGLHSPVPNPFSGRTAVSFALPYAARVNLAVYSVAGTLVRTVTSDQLPAGYHQAVWDSRDNDGRACGAGVYLVRFEAGDFTATRKLVLNR